VDRLHLARQATFPSALLAKIKGPRRIRMARQTQPLATTIIMTMTTLETRPTP
jgi:hypothetical protein